MKDILEIDDAPLVNHFTETKLVAKSKLRSIQRSHIITFENYTNVILSKCNIAQLKSALKLYKLGLSGTKDVLINRLTNHFNRCKFIIIIQKRIRGFITRSLIILQHNACTNKLNCVNDTDFVTMEPLNEIPDKYFYSFTDSKSFSYGFNIFSLIQMIKMKNKLVNPYNREKIEQNVINDIIKLYRLLFLVYSEVKDTNDFFRLDLYLKNYKYLSTVHYRIQPTPAHVPAHVPAPVTAPIQALAPIQQTLLTTEYNPHFYNFYTPSDASTQQYNRIREIRTMNVQQRINNLFIEMDQLGNYTQGAWFSTLDIRCYIRLYRALYDIWAYRSQLPINVRMNICQFYAPFDGIFTNLSQINNISLNEIQMACLIVIENMVYSGIDDDHRKIGAFHALSGLTIVSLDARLAMPWLYESVAY
jgi:hypothetical protein